MKRLLRLIGRVVFFFAWPAFWIYYRRGHGRTRVVSVYAGDVLVMKQWISAGKWGLPGGGLHKNEPAADGAARELREETGVSLEPGQLREVGQATFNSRGLKFDYHVFAARVGSKDVTPQRIELSDLEWKSPDALNELNSSPETLQALKMVRQKTSLLE